MRRTRAVLHRTRELLAGHDLALASAGAAFYGALAVVPSLLVAISVAGLLFGDDRIEGFGDRLAEAVPTEQGGDAAVVDLLDAGTALTLTAVLFGIVAASAYGIGLQRALVRVAPPHEREIPPSWRLRLLTLPLLGLAPLMVVGLLAVAPLLADLSSGQGAWGAVLAVFVSLNVVWVLSWAPLTWVYRIVGPGRPSWRAAFVGAVVAGAFVSGFLQGFLVFLALPIDLGRPFGGLVVVALVSGVLLWLWVLHLVVVVGYAMTWALDEARNDVQRKSRNAVPLSGSLR